jgi:hypothetical protein
VRRETPAPSGHSSLRWGGLIRRATLALALTLFLCLFALTLTGGAQASKVIYDIFGNPTTTVPTGNAVDGGLFNNPRGIAVNTTGTGGAAAGDVYVVNSTANRIDQFDSKGRFIRAFGRNVIEEGKTNDNATGYEICDTTVGNVVADCKAGEVTPQEGGTLSNPQGIAINQTTSHLYVSDQGLLRVDEFDATGHFVRAFGQDVVSAGPDNAPVAAARQTLTVDATEGQFKLTFRGQTTNDIAFDATAATVQAALQALGTIGAGNAAITGGPGGAGGGTPYVVTFAGTLNNAPMPLISTAAGTTPLGGGVGAAVVNTITGSTGFEICSAPLDTCKTGVSGERAGALSSTFSGHLAVAPASAPNAGDVLVTDPGNRRVNEYTSTGAFVRSFGFDVMASPPNATTTFEICAASSFDVCKAGAASGSGVGQFGTNGPNRVAVDSTGAIYTLEQESPNFRVQKFTPAGANLTPSFFNPAIGVTPAVFLSGASVADAPTDIAIGASDNVFVTKVCEASASCPNATSSSERRIYQFNSAGNLVDTHIAGAAISSANGLAADPASGRLYLSSTTGSHRVYIIGDPPSQVPVVTTGPSGPGAESFLATLEGVANPNGFKLSNCHFEYGPTSEYGQSTPCVPGPAGLGEGSADVAVTASTEPLEPNTVYHYRLFAANVGQSGQGKDRTFTTGPAPSDDCPNAARRAEQGVEALQLPDCMALEMVSPPQKAQQLANLRSGGVSADGARVLYTSIATLGDSPSLTSGFGDPYVASRSASGWRTASTSPPPQIQIREKAQSFTSDFSHWFHIGSLAGQSERGIEQTFEGGLDGLFSPVSPLLIPLSGISGRVVFAGASFDRSHLYLVPNSENPSNAYIAGDPVPAGAGSNPNIYVARRTSSGQPSLELLVRDRDGKVWGGNCGAALGGTSNSGAIAADGSRVYFSTRPTQPPTGACTGTNKMRIMLRVETPTGPQISELLSSECVRVSPSCSIADGDDIYQGASIDQTKIYFTSSRQLTSSDLDATSDLYLYDSTKLANERLTQVSAGEVTATHPTVGSGAAVSAVTATSKDGSHAYFTSSAVLSADQNPEGKEAQPGQANLYLYEAESSALSFVGTVGASGVKVAYPVPLTGRNLAGDAIGGDGHILLLASAAKLTANDTDDSDDIFRYDADVGTLQRVSRAGSGGSDNGIFPVGQIPSTGKKGTDEAEVGRWVSEDGETVAFFTAEALLPADVNGLPDAYIWRHGTLFRLPGSATPPAIDTFNPVLSHDGSTIAFVSTQQLLPADGDTVSDVYVARVDGGYPAPPPPPTCEGEGCQGAPATISGEIGAASSSFAGHGNVEESTGPKCRKGKVRKHGKCVQKHRKKSYRSKKSHGKVTTHGRGGSK